MYLYTWVGGMYDPHNEIHLSKNLKEGKSYLNVYLNMEQKK